MDTKLIKIATIAFVSLLALTGIVYGAYWVYSNTVTHTITTQSLALTVESTGLEVTLTASGANPGATVQFGITSDAGTADDGDFTFIGSAVAGSGGNAILTYTESGLGTYYYSARAYNTDLP